MPDIKLGERDKLEIFVAVENPIRLNMLLQLYEREPMNHSEISRIFGLTEKDYSHHMNILMNHSLVKPDWTKYNKESNPAIRENILNEGYLSTTMLGKKAVELITECYKNEIRDTLSIYEDFIKELLHRRTFECFERKYGDSGKTPKIFEIYDDLKLLYAIVGVSNR